MKQINSKTTGDQYTAEEFDEGVRGELQNMIPDTGQTFNEADQTQLGQSVTRIASTILNYTDAGAVNAYVLNSITSTFDLGIYLDGMVIGFNPANTNTGASTANINGLGAKNIVDLAGAALIGGELSILTYTYVQYDEGNDRFILMPINAVDAALKNELAINTTQATAGANLIGLGLTGDVPTTTQSYLGNLIRAGGTILESGGVYSIDFINSFNLASVVKNGPGDVTVTYTNNIGTADLNITTRRGDPIINAALFSGTPTDAQFIIKEVDGNASLTDASFNFIIFKIIP